MSTSTQYPPISRQPPGATFIAASIILGVFGLLQFLAVAHHYYPLLRQKIVDSVPAPSPLSLPQQPSRPSPATSPSTQDASKIQALFAQADHDFAVGNFDEALKSVGVLESLLPGHPDVLRRKALALEQSSRFDEAIQALQQILEDPALAPEVRSQTQRKIGELFQTISNAGITTPTLPTSPKSPDETGLAPDSTLGIVTCGLTDGPDGTKHLKLALKSRSGITVSAENVKIVVYFYETAEDGAVVLTDSRVISQWLTPPINWANGDPEIVDMQYIAPKSEIAPGRTYYGYVVGVYYDGALQASRLDPVQLSAEIQLPKFLKDK